MDYPLFSDIPLPQVEEIEMTEAEWELLKLEIVLGGF
jgi:hypothetical protein